MLLDAAEQRIVAVGINRTSPPDIANAADRPVGVVFRTFGKKDLVLERILDRPYRPADRSYRRLHLATDTTDPEERLGQAIAALFDIVWAYHDGQRVFVAHVRGAPAPLPESLKLRQRHLVHVYAGLIAEAVPEAAAQELRSRATRGPEVRMVGRGLPGLTKSTEREQRGRGARPRPG